MVWSLRPSGYFHEGITVGNHRNSNASLFSIIYIDVGTAFYTFYTFLQAGVKAAFVVVGMALLSGEGLPAPRSPRQVFP
jgi:hypothetical protein